MSRQLKFRFWDGQKFENNMGITGDGEIVDLSECFQNDAGKNGQYYTVQQYTGIKDSNGVEIYEGDIVENANFIGEVVFKNGSYRMEDRIKKITNFQDWIVGAIYWDRVIGNIFENKELLKN